MFDEIVFKYVSGQQHQLVYIALSRVTTIEGLYMVNDKNDSGYITGVAAATRRL
jgi:hypothetical protein